LVGYYWYGLTGLGVSFLVSYVIYAMQVFFVSKSLYDFKIDDNLIQIFFVNLSLTACGLLVALLMENLFVMYSLGSLLIVFSVVYNFNKLDKRMGLREVLNWRKK
jgi:hypothetical protein